MTPGEAFYNGYASKSEAAGYPLREWANLPDENRAQWEKSAANSSDRQAKMRRNAERIEAFVKFFRRPLRPRHTLPGDMRTEWLHGWWCGIGVGCVIGAAGAVMAMWAK